MAKRRQHEDGVMTEERTRVDPPSLYKVLLHNDDYTPMDFVVMILETVFRKNHPDAIQIMLSVHNLGIGVCGTYTYEIANQKMLKVSHLARQNEHPLKCTIEPE